MRGDRAPSPDAGSPGGAAATAGADPLDSDSDDVCDGGATVPGSCGIAGPDNCPFVSNPGQGNSDSLPAGDGCQCGDIDGDNDSGL